MSDSLRQHGELSARRPLPWYLLPQWPWLALAALLFAYVTLGASEFSTELARWHAAAGREQQLEGNPQRALSHLDNAVAYDAENPEFYRWRAECYRELSQHERALEEYDRLAQIRSLETWSHFQRADLLMLLGRRQQAVAAAREGLDAFQQTGAATSALGNAQVLNGVAYFRAVAQLELDEALPQITEAIQLLGGQPRIFMDYAYLCFLQEQYPLALKMLFASEQIYTDRLQNQIAALESAESLVSQDDIRSRIRDLQKSLGRVLYYRLLVVRKQVGQLQDRFAAIPSDNASERKQLAQQLADKQGLAGSVETRLADELESGVEAGEDLPLPTKQDLVEMMRLYAMVIDTRGFLYYQREEYAAAFQDVRLAVQIGESVASEWLSIQRGKETDLRQLERERRSFCRSLATIRYHRLLVASRLKASSMADEDRQRIEELGHQATPELF